MKKFVAPIMTILIIAVLVLAGKFLMTRFINQASLVGCVDQDKIFAAKQFQDAQKEYESYSKEISDAYNQKSRGMTQEKKTELMDAYKLQLDQKRAVILNPLKKKVENSIAYTSRKNNVEVILDKKIAVFGVKDLTEEVIKNFESGKEFKTELSGGKNNASPIGYFDQDVIRNLKAFRDMDEKLSKIYEEMQKEAKDKINKAQAQDKIKMLERYELDFGRKRAELYGPISDLVGKVVEKISKEKGLSLVLDRNSVMYGGLNVTDEVVKEFRAQTEKK